MEDEPRVQKKYIVVIQLKKAPSYLARLQEAVPRIQQTLGQLSHGKYELAFQSDDGGLFAYLIKTRAPIYVLREALVATQTEEGAILLNGDHVLLLELAPEFTAYGFSNTWSLLQHD